MKGKCPNLELCIEELGKEKTMMKNAIYILLVAGLMGWGAYKWVENRKNERAERLAAYRAEQESRRQREAAEELKRKEAEEEEAAKSKALRILRTYLDKEEKTLKDIIEESNVAVELIKEDQLTLSSTLRELDRENDMKAENFRKRNKVYYDKAERVLAILDSEKLNQLAEKYIGEDFSAMKAEYKSQIETMIKMHRETIRRLKSNRDKYNKAVAGIDDEVDKKNAKAQSKTASANAALEARLKGLYKSLNGKKSRLSVLSRGMSSPSSREEAKSLELEIDKIEQEVAKLEEIVALSRANIAHVEATTTETSARRKYDAAISTRQDDDNDVHADIAHEKTIYNTALLYEGRSLDCIRNAMNSRIDILNVRAFDAKKNLDYIADATKSIDFMSSKDLEALRVDISKRLSQKILKVAE